MPEVAITGIGRFAVIVVLGALSAVMIAALHNPLPWRSGRLYPALYRLPKLPGGTPLRLAMVHDVLHERYLRHGAAWYEARDARCRAILASQDVASAPDPAFGDALDDLAVGLDRLGRPDEAVALMRTKLARSTAVAAEAAPPAEAPSPSVSATADRRAMLEDDTDELLAVMRADLDEPARQRYTAWANLGTVLIHGSIPSAIAGDPDAVARLQEGLAAVRTAMRINPGAHFGRETWQAVAVEHLLAAIRAPDLLRRFTLIGDPLDAIAVRPSALSGHAGSSYGRHWTEFARSEAAMSPTVRVAMRGSLARVGISPAWRAAVGAVERHPKPFDEPVLGLIGMWTLGGGPSPHSALAIGKVMEDIGERHIAWTAYERAVSMRDRWWPDQAIVDRLVEWCRGRQAAIATAVAGAGADAWQARMRETHRAELAWGLAYQQAYHAFEAAELAAGHDLDAPGAYDRFFAGRPPIATVPRREDDVRLTDHRLDSPTDAVAVGLFGAAVAGLLAAVTDGCERPFRRRRAA